MALFSQLTTQRRRTKAQRRTTSTRLGAAIVFIALGLGNMYYGQQRYSEYNTLLSKPNTELTSPEKKMRPPLLAPTANVDKHSQWIEKVKSRIDFYQLVAGGGVCFLALGGVFLVLAYLSGRRAKDESPSGQEGESDS